jgi:hypothetical protein
MKIRVLHSSSGIYPVLESPQALLSGSWVRDEMGYEEELPRCYKSKWSPLCTPASSRTICHSLDTSFHAPEKKEREKRRKKKDIKWGLLGFMECCFSFPISPWRYKTGLLPRSCRVTCKALRTKGLWWRWSSRLDTCQRTSRSLHPRKDMWWPLWHFMNGDLVCHHTGSSTHFGMWLKIN